MSLQNESYRTKKKSPALIIGGQKVNTASISRVNIARTQTGQKGGDDTRRFRTTIGQIKKLIDRGQSGPDRVDQTKQSLVKWWHYSVTISATIHHDSSQFEADDKIGEHRDASGWKNRNSSINKVSHDAPTVTARFIYGSTTTHDGSDTIQHGGATNAHDASTIQYGASTIQAGSATVASRPPTKVHD